MPSADKARRVVQSEALGIRYLLHHIFPNSPKQLTMKNLLITSILLLLSTFPAGKAEDYAGLCGASLKQAVRQNSVPQSLCRDIYGEGGIWEAFKSTDCNVATGGILDRFEDVSYPISEALPPIGMSIFYILDPSWWLNDPGMSDMAAYDLYNLYPTGRALSDARDDKTVPGIVTDGAVNIGGVIFGVAAGEMAAWMPQDDMKGDVARVVFYMATQYPSTLWHGFSYNMFVDNSYPTLNRRAVTLMMSWHLADPVDDSERRRVDEVEKVQGNRNPYVDHPWLADYIWGEKRETPVGSDVPIEVPDDPTVEIPVPLKGSYDIGEKLWLTSPFVPETATWSIDGRGYTGQRYVECRALGSGKHEIKFEASGRRGRVTIIIK